MRSFLLAMGLAILVATPVLAPPAVSAARDPAPGGTPEVKAALLAATCSGCHVKAATKDGFPSIYGRPAAEIRDRLFSFRSGQREGTVMNRLAKGYDDAEIELLATYLSAEGTAR